MAWTPHSMSTLTRCSSLIRRPKALSVGGGEGVRGGEGYRVLQLS